MFRRLPKEIRRLCAGGGLRAKIIPGDKVCICCPWLGVVVVDVSEPYPFRLPRAWVNGRPFVPMDPMSWGPCLALDTIVGAAYARALRGKKMFYEKIVAELCVRCFPDAPLLPFLTG